MITALKEERLIWAQVFKGTWWSGFHFLWSMGSISKMLVTLFFSRIEERKEEREEGREGQRDGGRKRK